MTQEPGKRIVSKKEYAGQVFRKTGWSISSFGTGVMGVMLFAMGTLLWYMAYGDNNCPDAIWKIIGVMTLGSLVCTYCSYKFGKIASKAPLDIPLTRTNTSSLLASDILVRASSEPLQTQQAILLRAAMETTDKQEEELLRASSGELQC